MSPPQGARRGLRSERPNDRSPRFSCQAALAFGLCLAWAPVGAIEPPQASASPPLFADDFESGDDAAWLQALAQPQQVDVGISTTKTITLTGTSPHGPALSFRIVTAPATGSLGPITATGPTTATVDYTAPAALGPDSFRFEVDDGIHPNAAVIDVQVVTVTAPVATDASATTPEDTAVVVALAGTDAENDPLVITLVSAPSNGTLSGLTATGPQSASVTYTPAPDWFGVDSFQFRVDDGNGGTDLGTAQVTVQSVADAPTAIGGSATTPRGAAVTLTLTATDVDDLPLVFSADTPPQNGVLSAFTTLDATSAKVTYTPNDTFSGNDAFDLRVTDQSALSDVVSVSITVEPAPNYTHDASARGVWSLDEDVPAGGGAQQVDTRLDASAAANHLTTDFDVTLSIASPVEGVGAADFPGTTGAHLDRHNPNGALAPPFLSADFPGVVDSNYTLGTWVLLRAATVQKIIDMRVLRLEVTSTPEIRMLHKSTAGNHFATLSGAPTLGQWMHVVVRFDRGADPGQKLALFVNGQVAAYGASDPADLATDTAQFSLGSDIFGNGALDGLMDESFVFNRPLTNQEIEEIYLCRVDGSACSP